ncbi:hypothetical protein BH10PSE7_BH10PSE7_44720 [soil metagenome]
MRDISADLHERLREAESSRQNLQAQFETERQAVEARFKQNLAALDSEVTILQGMIDIEDRRRGEPIKRKRMSPTLPIKDFLVKIAKERGPVSKGMIRDLTAEAGYFQSGENPGRSTHGHLMQLLRAGKLIQDEKKSFRTPPETAGHSQGNDPTYSAGPLQ